MRLPFASQLGQALGSHAQVLVKPGVMLSRLRLSANGVSVCFALAWLCGLCSRLEEFISFQVYGFMQEFGLERLQ